MKNSNATIAAIAGVATLTGVVAGAGSVIAGTLVKNNNAKNTESNMKTGKDYSIEAYELFIKDFNEYMEDDESITYSLDDIDKYNELFKTIRDVIPNDYINFLLPIYNAITNDDDTFIKEYIMHLEFVINNYVKYTNTYDEVLSRIHEN